MIDRRMMLKLGALGLSSLAAAGCAGHRRQFHAQAYGARGDGRALETGPLQQAIDAAGAAGGGTVTLQPGLYRTGALFVKSGVTLVIGRGVTLLGSQNLADYPILPTRVAGIEMPWPAGLLNIYRKRDARIIGEGLVDGNGKPFWDSYWALRRQYEARGLRWAADYDCRRPRLIHIFEADRAEVAGLRLARSGFWTVHVCYSRDVRVADLVIRNNEEARGPSTDGIDVDSSERVLVERCDLSVNDDALCIKAGRDWDGLRVARPCRDVRIRDCVVREAHAGMTFGSETSGGFERIDVSNLRIERAVPIGIFFKSGHTRGGTLSNIRVRDIDLSGVPTLLRVNLNWYPNYSYATLPEGMEDIPSHWRALTTPVPRTLGIPKVRDVHMAGIRASDGGVGIEAEGYPEAPLTDFRFDRLDWQVKRAGQIRFARNWRFQDCRIRAADGKPLRIEQSQGMILPDISAA